MKNKEYIRLYCTKPLVSLFPTIFYTTDVLEEPQLHLPRRARTFSFSESPTQGAERW